MGLPRALKAHGDGDLETAEQHYQRALDQGSQDPIVFQNYGALLRKRNRVSEADAMYVRGLALHPDHIGILTNRANLLQDSSPAISLACHLRALRLLRHQSAERIPAEPFINTISHLRQLGMTQWALALSQEALQWVGPEAGLLLQCLLLQDGHQQSDAAVDDQRSDRLRQRLEAQLEDCQPLARAEVQLSLATHYLGEARLDQAERLFGQGMDTLRNFSSAEVDELSQAQKLIDIHSWNQGCTLLQQQQLQRGWQLFEHGLRTPADGPQRWQRALRKPFSADQLPLWRGESLSGRRLLLLEEQAIGDAMMFITLLPGLLDEAAALGLVVSDRLLPIYRRSFDEWIAAGRVQVWSYEQAASAELNPEEYDLQSPVGSICQYRFTDVMRYGRHLPLLKAPPEATDQFRSEYLNQRTPVQRLIGLSWQGGGTGVRIKQKSLKPQQFHPLMRDLPGVRFVSLQYGKAEPIVQAWQAEGLDVIFDPRVDPLKDMDLWLGQVAACDAVLSVANTTIHGAAGLNLPTLCLLSRHHDWRWFTDPAVDRSYWYPSVGIAREQEQQGWEPALDQARHWLEQGCPLPTGPVHTRASALA